MRPVILRRRTDLWWWEIRSENRLPKIAAEELKDRKGLRIFFVTGKRYYDEIVENADPAESRVTYLKYIDNMPAYLSACNLAITRSGALTVSEIAACGRASVMIPSPYVTNNHQFFNAKVASDRAASILIEEKDLKPGMISELIGYGCGRCHVRHHGNLNIGAQ